MSQFETLSAAGINPEQWQRVVALAKDFCARDSIPAIGLVAGRHDATSEVHLFGRQGAAADSRPIRDDAIFLVASITKPIVAASVLKLVERGEFALVDRVCDLIPEFGGKGRYGITVRHLLTHTSGLPDMLPDNRELRAAHAPLSRFIARICEIKPSFPPGTNMQYQSTGIALLAEIVQRVTGMSCADFLRQEFFEPLGMDDTSLGAPESWFAGSTPQIERVAGIRISKRRYGHPEWDWNSKYWRTFGAPWGGLLTTPADLARFAQMMLLAGDWDGSPLLSAATVEAATSNQLETMADLPEEIWRCQPWGFGWRLNWPGHADRFGDLLGPQTYGHWGATGTLMWVDPNADAFAVILTTQPKDQSAGWIVRLSNAIAASFV